MSSERIPVILLTGFLGSGKTSLLRRVIQQPGFSECAVIINEFGEVGLDQSLVSEVASDQDIQLLDSGCLCCLASNSIQETLSSLYYRRLRKEIPWFNRVLIETSGLAEPGPIINSIYGDYTLNRFFRLERIITTFDSQFGHSNTEHYAEAKEQLMMADLIVITKEDTQEKPDSSKLHHWLKELAPHAHILSNQLKDEVLAHTLLFHQLNKTDMSERQVAPANQKTSPSALPSHFRHLMRYGIQSVVISVSHAVTWPQWARFVKETQTRIGSDLLRLKGILEFKEEGPKVVHAVHHLFSYPEPIKEASSSLVGTLIFIVRDVAKEDIEELIQYLSSEKE